MKFYVYSPPYDERSGGSVCLHYLCHLLNECGHEAYLVPSFDNVEFNLFKLKYIYRILYKGFLRHIRRFVVNPAMRTPVVKYPPIGAGLADAVVIYPEKVIGNPLEASIVVRWLLHNPGFHGSPVYYQKNELYFKFNSAIADFNFPGSVLSEKELKVIRYPLEHYNLSGVSTQREGTAYCLRKGRGKKIQHDLNNSILIDDLTHKEISSIFKNVKTFISYDTLTAYSVFAVLCGCDSVVIPDEGVDEESWYPDPSDRYGIAYGFEKLDESRKTQHLVAQRIIEEHENNYSRVRVFIDEVSTHFDL